MAWWPPSRRPPRFGDAQPFSAAQPHSPSAVRPPLITAAVAGPELQRRTVAGSGARGVQAEARLGVGDGSVGVEGPLLVRLAVAAPDVDLGAGGCALVGGV